MDIYRRSISTICFDPAASPPGCTKLTEVNQVTDRGFPIGFIFLEPGRSFIKLSIDNLPFFQCFPLNGEAKGRRDYTGFFPFLSCFMI